MNIRQGVLLCIAALFLMAPTVEAMDCAGPWQVLPKHLRGKGAPCQALGLDTNSGVCQPGQTHETLCDDTSNHRYKTCQGPRICDGYGNPVAPAPQHGCTSWDYLANKPCPPGYVNPDCQGGCQSAAEQNDCTRWDYIYNQPCPPGFINRDCYGSCEPI